MSKEQNTEGCGLNELLSVTGPNSSACEYYRWLGAAVENAKNGQKDTYGDVIEKVSRENKDGQVFLSVITRTQGNRPEMLREALLCLYAQTCENFELIIVCHKTEAEKKAEVEALVRQFPECFRCRIKVVELDYGNRTAPLNYGFAMASGEYCVILDDDDLVMDNWVEEFYNASEKNKGKILHSYVLSQHWSTVVSKEGTTALRAESACNSEFCRDFEFTEQLRMNHCPIHGLAFPSYLFRDIGLRFDETLTTTEDWDFLMRSASIAGVYNIRSATAIYRFWDNAESSHTKHDPEEWQNNYNAIEEKFNSMPMIIGAGEKKLQSATESAVCESVDNTGKSIFEKNTLHRIRAGSANIAEDTATAEVVIDAGRIFAHYDLQPMAASELRFTPCEIGIFTMRNVKAVVKYSDGSSNKYDCKWTSLTGAYQIPGGVFICGRNPSVNWAIEENKSVIGFDIIADICFDNTIAAVSQAVAEEQKNAIAFKNAYENITKSLWWRILAPFRKLARLMKRLCGKRG